MLVCDTNEQVNDVDSNRVSTDLPRKIKEATELIQKIRLLAIKYQPQLHKLISRLEQL
jgi:hypothetical protein